MINLASFAIFRDNRKSLKELSSDTSDKNNIQYMTESQRQATDFDLVKRLYLNSLYHSEDDAQSVDALTQTEDTVIFIEFKNGAVHASDIKTKVRDSLLMYCDITKNTIANTRADSVLVLVYNLEKNPRPNQLKKGEPPTWRSQVAISRYFAKKGNRELIRFDLERFEGLCFREVHTYTKEEFEQYLQWLYA